MIEVKNILGKPRKFRGQVIEPQALYSDTVYNADIEPGKSIRLHGIHCTKPIDITFKIGDPAEYDSSNLHYLGVITKITANTVTITENRYGTNAEGSNHRLHLYEFCWRNYDFNLEKISARNHEESLAH